MQSGYPNIVNEIYSKLRSSSHLENNYLENALIKIDQGLIMKIKSECIEYSYTLA